MTRPMESAYKAREKRIGAECASFTIVVGVKNDQDIFERHHHCKRPNDQGCSAKEIDVIWCLGKSRREDIERARADVSIDDTGRLIG